MGSQLDHWSKKMDEVKAKKEAITGKIEEDKQASIQAKNDLAKMKKSIGYGSETDIDDRIAAIQAKIQFDTIPLKGEKWRQTCKQATKVGTTRPASKNSMKKTPCT